MNHNRFLKFVSLMIVFVISFSSLCTFAYAADKNDNVWIRVFYGGLERAFRNKPFIHDSELYLPLRELVNLCGVSDDDILYDNGKISILFKTNPDIWVTAEMNVNQNGITFDKDSKYDIMGIESIRSTTHPVIEKNDTAYIPIGMLIRIKNYYVSQNYDRRVYLNLLGDLEIWQYALKGEYFPAGRYDVVLSAPIDVTKDKKYDISTYFNDGEDVFIGTISDFENKEFTHTEINGYYYPTEAHKWILVDDDNKAIAVIPYENFRHEAVDPSPFGVSSWEIAKAYLDDICTDTTTHTYDIPYGRGGLDVCQIILRTKQDGMTYSYLLPYCFVDFRYLVK